MPSSNFLWILMSRCLSKEASVEEENELMEILKKDEELQLKYNMLLHLWKKKEFENIDFEDQNGIENIIASAEGNAEGSNKTSKGIFIIKRISIAAALICLFVAGVWFWKKYADRNNLPRDLSAERMIETPNGNRTKILLPDGTSVSVSYTHLFAFSKKIILFKSGKKILFKKANKIIAEIKPKKIDFISNFLKLKPISAKFSLVIFKNNQTIIKTGIV